MSLECSHDWYKRVEYESTNNSGWLSLSPERGEGGQSYEIRVKVEPNNGEQRSATVFFYLTGYDKQCSLHIIQDKNSKGGNSTKLSAPTGLRASASGNNVSLSWNSVSGASYYNIYYSTSSSGSKTYLAYTSQTSKTVEINTSGSYYFFVTAEDSNGNQSDYSSYAYCTIQGGGQTPTKPSTPSGLTAYWDGPASYPYVVLQWNSVNTATSYLIYRATSANGSYSKIGDSSYNSYSDNNVSIGKTYYYKIKASNSAGTSDYSSYTSVTLEDKRAPGPVTYGSCTATSTSITLRWTIPTDASYGKPTKIILRLYEPTTGQWVDAQTLSGTATSVTFSFGMWLDSDGYVKCGVIPYNDYGSGGGYAKVYDYKNKRWIN